MNILKITDRMPHAIAVAATIPRSDVPPISQKYAKDRSGDAADQNVRRDREIETPHAGIFIPVFDLASIIRKVTVGLVACRPKRR